MSKLQCRYVYLLVLELWEIVSDFCGNHLLLYRRAYALFLHFYILSLTCLPSFCCFVIKWWLHNHNMLLFFRFLCKFLRLLCKFFDGFLLFG